MWDNVNDNDQHLSHDLPCPRCGHGLHTFLACDERCDCAPCVMPGSELLLRQLIESATGPVASAVRRHRR